jgi:SAM-dependent methyltransferase
MIPNPTERFTGRVESYRRYRPRYPAEVADLLRRACGLSDDATIADIAAGTGLPDHSVDLITVAQAMHWFDLERTRAEFARILKPGGWCAVLYNNRRLGGDAFHESYERFLLDYGIDYQAVKGQHVGRKRLAQFFAPSPMQCESLLNAQPLTLEALQGRVLSSSYIPQPGDPRFPPMEAALEKLFGKHAHDGAVTMIHDCVLGTAELSQRIIPPQPSILTNRSRDDPATRASRSSARQWSAEKRWAPALLPNV